MMKLTPHEILTYLGISIPQDGLDINSHDLYLHATLLRLLGQQMRVDAIPGTELAELLAGLHGVHFGPGAVVPERCSRARRASLHDRQNDLRYVSGAVEVARLNPGKLHHVQEPQSHG
ncbi:MULTISPECIES: hypothetical protein [Burkholderia]|jgi:hypothetical protein|uniref:Uncharacterized protein n=1 Tax=Burkholderia contaminans TaxID=488447 RepID=A0AAP1VBV4_9BURK|nr:hypothetical protein [Burkholderia contaminans]ELK7724868.1 hypothetical protein [Burkholderia cenocepacia]UTP27810.1 hypothetical protein NMB33_40705 [Burkholderia sp. FXe9]HBN6128335.1 hypothetical protein [Clostridioides difficile]MBH9693793.1 hypothetical protein [Burkholderia contaminans]MBK1905452.1 hypothetical protein [Burkholderia contaminans]